MIEPVWWFQERCSVTGHYWCFRVSNLKTTAFVSVPKVPVGRALCSAACIRTPGYQAAELPNRVRVFSTQSRTQCAKRGQPGLIVTTGSPHIDCIMQNCDDDGVRVAPAPDSLVFGGSCFTDRSFGVLDTDTVVFPLPIGRLCVGLISR
jgi:hypothetical protein